MIGAIDFIMKWQEECKKRTCKDCELYRRGVCITRLREMSQNELLKAIQVVYYLNNGGTTK